MFKKLAVLTLALSFSSVVFWVKPKEQKAFHPSIFGIQAASIAIIDQYFPEYLTMCKAQKTLPTKAGFIAYLKMKTDELSASNRN